MRKRVRGVMAASAGVILIALLALGISKGVDWVRFHFTASPLQIDEKLIQSDPGAIFYWYKYSVDLLDAGRFNDAEAACRKMLAIEPKSELAHFQLGRIYARCNRVTEAREQFGIACRSSDKRFVQRIRAEMDRLPGRTSAWGMVTGARE